MEANKRRKKKFQVEIWKLSEISEMDSIQKGKSEKRLYGGPHSKAKIE